MRRAARGCERPEAAAPRRAPSGKGSPARREPGGEPRRGGRDVAWRRRRARMHRQAVGCSWGARAARGKMRRGVPELCGSSPEREARLGARRLTRAVAAYTFGRPAPAGSDARRALLGRRRGRWRGSERSEAGVAGARRARAGRPCRGRGPRAVPVRGRSRDGRPPGATRGVRYPVDPAGSHMLVLRAKPCTSQYERLKRRNCEWLITSAIIHLAVTLDGYPQEFWG